MAFIKSKTTLKSPFILRFSAWLEERFPLINLIMAGIAYYMVRRIFFDLENRYELQSLVGTLIFSSQFLILRILDEHKDNAEDNINHPERVIQLGWIKLDQLKWLGCGCILFQVIFMTFFTTFSWELWVTWAAMQFWTFLMAKEFFVGSWLKKNLSLYAFSHILVTPFIFIWMMKWINNEILVSELFNFPLARNILLMTFFGGYCYELTRKTKGLDEEKATNPSYTTQLGVNAALLRVAFYHFIFFLEVNLCISNIGKPVNWPWRAVPIFIFVLILHSLFRFFKNPTAKNRDLNEKFSGLLLLVAYLMVAFC